MKYAECEQKYLELFVPRTVSKLVRNCFIMPVLSELKDQPQT